MTDLNKLHSPDQVIIKPIPAKPGRPSAEEILQRQAEKGRQRLEQREQKQAKEAAAKRRREFIDRWKGWVILSFFAVVIIFGVRACIAAEDRAKIEQAARAQVALERGAIVANKEVTQGPYVGCIVSYERIYNADMSGTWSRLWLMRCPTTSGTKQHINKQSPRETITQNQETK